MATVGFEDIDSKVDWQVCHWTLLQLVERGAWEKALNLLQNDMEFPENIDENDAVMKRLWKAMQKIPLERDDNIFTQKELYTTLCEVLTGVISDSERHKQKCAYMMSIQALIMQLDDIIEHYEKSTV